MSSLSKQGKRKAVNGTDKNKRSRIIDSDLDEEEATQPIPEQMEVDAEETPQKRPPLERMAPGAPFKQQSEDNELHRTDNIELNRNLLDNFNQTEKPVIDEETKELVIAALPLLSDDAQAQLKSVFIHRKIEWFALELNKNGERIQVPKSVILSDAQLEEVKDALRSNPESIPGLLESYCKKPVLGDDDDALMASMLDETEKQLEEEAKKPPPANIFTVAEDMDKEWHHNLYFENPVVQDASISFKREYSKQLKKSFENFRIGFQNKETHQRFLDKVFYNLSLITPPGNIELFNAPPFGDLSDLNSGREYAPDHPSKCRWSLNYTSKHFYHDSDRDDIEYDQRTRKVYAEIQESEKKALYLKEHPELKNDPFLVPEEAYEFKQESPLTQAQLDAIPDNERFGKNSKKVNAWFHFIKTYVEEMYFNKVRTDPEGTNPAYKRSVENSIQTSLKEAQTREDKAAEKEKRKPARLQPEKFEDVLERNMKSLIKTEKSGGHKVLKFGGNLFRSATDVEKQKLQSGEIQCSNAKITKICKENGLMEQSRLLIYRFPTAEEEAQNPDGEPLQLMSVGEAYKYIRQFEGKVIGQVVCNPAPIVVKGDLMLKYYAHAIVVWGASNAYREPRRIQQRERPKIERRVYAPPPTVTSNKPIVDTSDFDNMDIPEMLTYKKKETAPGEAAQK